MTASKRFRATFGSPRPILAMLHLSGDTPDEIFRVAIEELAVLEKAGVDAVVVENYFGSVEDVERVLAHLAANPPRIVYGLNVLGDDIKAFELARRYGAAFVQLDSVVGHVEPEREEAFGARLAELRATTDAIVLGGVRFKYQPVLSARTVAEDLVIARDRCDAVVVTSEGTGIETDLDKIREFRQALGDFPLIVGAGVTADNLHEQLELADAAIVGSYLKDTYQDTGRIDGDHVAGFLAARDAFVTAQGLSVDA
jgi:predicted TIM-barrel enzyme